MFPRASSLLTRSACWSRASTRRIYSRPRLPRAGLGRPVPHRHLPLRPFSTGKSAADEIIEDISEQYATAKDEFEIAVEETERNTLYAAEDRAAAAEEMDKLKEMYESALEENSEEVAGEVKRRIGQRIRELDEAIKGLEESAHE